ncbi:hypothetical protein N474_01915 [Pseudoalteromonas luteoviolacea CPMOR-2]|uniref:LytR/AlgR family response regulator transcription factor n=1 Tax=Pseudoalteromonas luteoviolacea TaxID=43657 RepID=UPI0007B08724|nr:LytTR family DNA-binding domain-containing protein [Pseudoalteromonas luteoviolacea]KZN54500.1 hypothetical protein N474_01915 [Pseudoalteromonas luteoviolacea CPMOR-2]
MQAVEYLLQVARQSQEMLCKAKLFEHHIVKAHIGYLFCALGLLLTSLSLSAEEINKFKIHKVKVCGADMELVGVPHSSRQDCQIKTIDDVDSKARLVWVIASFDLGVKFEQERGPRKPLGLFMSAKASAEFYLNGELIGRNGLPADSIESEESGIMDTVVYLPENILKASQNELAIKLSSHHNVLGFEQMIQRLIITDYASPQNMVLRHYLPTFIPFGILLIGLLYSAYLLVLREGAGQPALLTIFSFFVLAQLAIEVSRGLFAYHYPFHEIRVLAILLLGACSGGCLLLYIANKFLNKWSFAIVWLAMCVTAVATYTATTMEEKTTVAIQVPAAFSVLLIANAILRKYKTAKTYGVALIMFSLALTLRPNQFLDVYFYYFIAALFIFFLAVQASDYRKEKAQRIIEQSRAQHLQLALDEIQEIKKPTKLKLNQAGKIEWVNSDQICFCKGARDYVELVLSDHRSVLHNESLSSLEEMLPSVFLRVHRSYLVNTRFIQSLEGASSGGGILKLSTGDEVPVSRRIMPSVRKVLC